MNAYQFSVEVYDQLRKAFELFDIGEIDYSDVLVDCNIRGGVAGRAGIDRQGNHYLHFNPEAIELYLDEMVKDTIPHEIAHTLCQIRPRLGRNHNAGWKRVCRALGGDDARTHTMKLTPGRVTNYYEYEVNGRVINIGPKRHAKIQRGYNGYTLKGTGRTKAITACMYMGSSLTKQDIIANRPANKTTKSKPAPKRSVSSTSGMSKKARAEKLYTTNRQLSRKDVIDIFVDQFGLTPAGASTYYYNCKKTFG